MCLVLIDIWVKQGMGQARRREATATQSPPPTHKQPNPLKIYPTHKQTHIPDAASSTHWPTTPTKPRPLAAAVDAVAASDPRPRIRHKGGCCDGNCRCFLRFWSEEGRRGSRRGSRCVLDPLLLLVVVGGERAAATRRLLLLLRVRWGAREARREVRWGGRHHTTNQAPPRSTDRSVHPQQTAMHYFGRGARGG